MEKKITKNYSNGDVTVIWQPHLCIHSGICAKGLPNVFQPQKRPWVKPDAATTQQIVEQVAQCPTGALSSKMNNETNDGSTKINILDTQIMKATVTQNGPLIINGDVELTFADGTTTVKEGKVAICRCGASGNKPYCDGTHVKIGWQG